MLPCCHGVPADPEQTEARVKEVGTLRVGIVESSEHRAFDGFVTMVEKHTGASAEPERGEAEHLLKKLENGQLDIVIGSFAKKSPWMRQVWLSKPLTNEKPADDKPVLRAAARNGENRWIMTIAKSVKQP